MIVDLSHQDEPQVHHIGIGGAGGEEVFEFSEEGGEGAWQG